MVSNTESVGYGYRNRITVTFFHLFFLDDLNVARQSLQDLQQCNARPSFSENCKMETKNLSLLGVAHSTFIFMILCALAVEEIHFVKETLASFSLQEY